MFRHIFQQEYVLHDALSGSKVDLMMRTLVLMLSFPTRVFVALVLMLLILSVVTIRLSSSVFDYLNYVCAKFDCS
jgi:ABC-type dipeptide/oligopeptide/nickel transport system permease subunit